MAVSDQVPTQSGFYAKSTGAAVLSDVDLTGKTAIVTGGYSGIGLETVCGLASKGASVVVPVRSPDKAGESLAGVQGNVETAPLDLADLASVRRFADTMLGALSRLDLLINNAGIMACPEHRVGPGWESAVRRQSHGSLRIDPSPLSALEEDTRRAGGCAFVDGSQAIRCAVG